jgi:hypothetical protein
MSLHSYLPPELPRPPRKPVGLKNRSKFLAGREGPADVPVIHEPLVPWRGVSATAEEAAAADKWMDKNKGKIAQPSHFTLQPHKYFEPKDNQFQAAQFDDVLSSNSKTKKVEKEIAEQNVSGLDGSGKKAVPNTGYLGPEHNDGPRRPDTKSWWVFRDDKVREFLEHIAGLNTWPKESDKKVAYTIENYYRSSMTDEEMSDTNLYYFLTANAAKMFRRKMINLGFELFGPDPDAMEGPDEEPVTERRAKVRTPWGTAEEHTIFGFPSSWRSASWVRWAEERREKS